VTRYTIAQVAKGTGMSISQTYRWAAKGVLSAEKVEGRWLVDIDTSFPAFYPPDKRGWYIGVVKNRMGVE
jgi:hypothetical protein